MVTRTGSAGQARVCGALGLVVALAAGLGGSGRAEAGANMTFTLTPQSGTGRITYAGGSSPLQGTGLQVASVTGLQTGAHPDGQLAISSGALSFTTGAFTGTTAGGSEWDFAKGGSIALDGGIASLGIPAGTKLLTGTFSNDSFVKNLGSGDLKVQGGAFMNVVDPTLAAYFGLPAGGSVYVGGLSTLFSGPASGSGFSSSSLTSGSVTTSPVPPNTSVPEPGTLAVFVALATGGALFARRRAAV